MGLHIYAQLAFTLEQLALYLVQKFNLSRLCFEEIFREIRRKFKLTYHKSFRVLQNCIFHAVSLCHK